MVAFRQAIVADAKQLSLIANASKAHWGYPQEWLDQWQETLTITPQQIREHHIVVATHDNDEVVGFIAIFNDTDRAELLHLEHLWLLPDWMGQGIGKQLFLQGQQYCRAQSTCARVHVLSDPHAVGFYEAMGFKKIGDVASSIKDRTLPLMALEMIPAT